MNYILRDLLRFHYYLNEILRNNRNHHHEIVAMSVSTLHPGGIFLASSWKIG